MNTSRTDIAILGGGIAGLWLLNLLSTRGYSAVLVEKQALGTGQTIASQGMIHGGIKYTLQGAMSNASETIADMPERWRRCLAGTGELDLSEVQVLSDSYYLFSDSRLSSRVTAFFGSKAVAGRVRDVPVDERPEVFRHPGFKGVLYQLQDLVLDVPSLLTALAGRHAEKIHIGAARCETHPDGGYTLKLSDGTTLNAARLILAAGEGNQALLRQLGSTTEMQLRPLNQVIVTGDLPVVYAHAVALATADKPRVTITTHFPGEEQRCWYLGGQLAESGVTRSDDAQIDFARGELTALFPWMSFDNCRFHCLRINRAEAASSGQRPDTPFVTREGNLLTCFPTKLTLTPLLGDMVLDALGDPELTDNDFRTSTSLIFAEEPWDQPRD